MRKDLPNMALVTLNITSVTPIVKVEGGGGGSIGVGAGVPSAVGAGAAGLAAALGGGEGMVITAYPLYSSIFLRKATRSGETFFSTMAHFTPSRSSNSWFLLIAIINVQAIN